jgi:F0F1-type ATP synthase assembly protein I
MTHPLKQRTEGSGLGETLRSVLPYTQIGWQLVSTILLFFGIGYALDIWLDLRPVCTITGAVLGVLVAMVGFIRSAQSLFKEK